MVNTPRIRMRRHGRERANFETWQEYAAGEYCSSEKLLDGNRKDTRASAQHSRTRRYTDARIHS